MTKKIVLFYASPRKGGNSDLLCDEFIRGAKAAGHETEKIVLRDKKIGYCLGCEYCRQNEGVCVQKDDMAELLDKIQAADVVVMATPVYFYCVSAQLKILIDRVHARSKRLGGKEFYLLMTAATSQKEKMQITLDAVRGFVSCLPGSEVKGAVFGSDAWEAGKIKNTAAFAEAYEMGKNV